jgi:hypothetical protein
MQTHETDLLPERIDLVRSRIPAPRPGSSRLDQVLTAVSLMLGASVAAMAALTLP